MRPQQSEPVLLDLSEWKVAGQGHALLCQQLLLLLRQPQVREQQHLKKKKSESSSVKRPLMTLTDRKSYLVST